MPFLLRPYRRFPVQCGYEEMKGRIWCHQAERRIFAVRHFADSSAQPSPKECTIVDAANTF